MRWRPLPIGGILLILPAAIGEQAAGIDTGTPRRIQESTRALIKRVETARHLTYSPIKPLKSEAADLFAEGMSAHRNGRHPIARRFLTRYLATTGPKTPRQQQAALLALARSQNHLEAHSGADAYRRYLALTQGHERIDGATQIEAARALGQAPTPRTRKSRKELRETLSALLQLRTPKEQRAELLFLIARMSRDAGWEKLAQQVARKAARETAGAAHQSHYLLGILAYGAGNWAGACRHFERTVRAQPGRMIAYGHLALARCYRRQRAYSKALKQFAKVPDRSALRPQADFERIFTALEKGAYPRARNLAARFLAGKPSRQSAYLAHLFPYLQLLAGSHRRARAQLRQNIRKIQELHHRIRKRSKKPGNDPVAALHDILRWGEGFVPPPQGVSAVEQWQQNLDAQGRAIARNQTQTGALITRTSHLRLAEVVPQLDAASAQARAFGDRLVALASQLLAHERALFATRLTDKDKLKLRRHDSARNKLRAPQNQAERRHRSWRSYSHAFQLRRRFIALQGQVQGALAELTGWKHRGLGGEDLLRKERAWTQLRGRLHHLGTSFRRTQIHSLAELSPLRPYARWFSRYLAIIEAQQDILSAHRQRISDPAAALLSDELAASWDLIRTAAARCLTELRRISQATDRTFSDLTLQLSRIDRRSQAHERQLAAARRLFARQVRSWLPRIAGHYDRALAVMLAQNRKWLGDAELAQVRPPGPEEIHTDLKSLGDPAQEEWLWPESS